MSEEQHLRGPSNITPVIQAALQVLMDQNQGVQDVRHELDLVKAAQRLADLSRGVVPR